MEKYREVPFWWYIAMFIASFAMAMATIYTAKSGLPWWGLIVALILSTVFLPFVITVYAITGMSSVVFSQRFLIASISAKGSLRTFSLLYRCLVQP